MTGGAHAPAAVWERGRYPWRGVCSCGWRAPWGYVAERAAREVAEAHAEEAKSPGP